LDDEVSLYDTLHLDVSMLGETLLIALIFKGVCREDAAIPWRLYGLPNHAVDMLDLIE
jgi:hypothetical protein